MYQLYSTKMSNYVRSNKVRVNTRLAIKQSCLVLPNKRNEEEFVYVYSVIILPIQMQCREPYAWRLIEI